MSHIEGLISHHCPDGVEFIALQELFNTRNGYTPSRKNPAYWENGTIPWFRLADIRGGDRILTEAIENVSPSAVKKSGLFPAGTIIISTLATIGEHALMEVPGLCNQQLTALTLREKYADLFNIKFLFYYTFLLADWCKKNTMNSSFASVDMKQFKRFKFPVPPLEVQDEIVRVLDSFTNLEANLQTELEARRQQYEYYRASLFDSAKLRSTSTELALGELGTWSGGGTPSKSVSSYWTEGYLWVSPKDMKQTYIFQTEDQISEEAVKSRGLRIYPPETILLVARSGILKHSLPVGILEKQATVNQDIKALRVNNSVTSKYALYTLQNYSQDILRKCHKAGGSVDSLDMKKLLAFQIPVPPLAEQERIVGILDKFDALVNDLSSGLPAEIEARRKQYEYYRDQLLTFTPVK